METTRIIVRLKPVPASRARVPRYGKPYYPKTYAEWIAATRELIPQSDLMISFPTEVKVVFGIPRAKTSKLIVPVGDGDNYEKATYDMLTHKGYLMDDKWLTKGSWSKRFLPYGSLGATVITLTPDLDPMDITEKELGL
jgi:Holliday junction resolvase RusA-like endonuclease